MNKKTFVQILIAVLLTWFLATGTTVVVVKAFNTTPKGGDYALNNQKSLFYNAIKKTGWKQPRNSTELENLLVRNIRFNNPNHKSYVYVYANNGAIKAFFPVISKCSAVDSSATSQWHAAPRTGNADTTGGWSGNDIGPAVDSPQLDGSFGGAEPGIFCLLDKPGHPMVQFNGDYIWSDTFIPLKQAPELVIGKVESHTKKGK
jgi:hypothetical protein